MGQIKCIKDSLVSEPYGNILNINNWRYIREGNHHDRPGVFMILENCRLFFIGDLSIEEIHNINYKNLSPNKLVIYIRNVLCCLDCDGVGTVDWIQNVTKANPKKRFDPASFYQFTRDKKGVVKEIHCITGKTLIVSSPVKKKGMNYCATCYGSGLRVGRSVVIKEFFLEKS